ncbi:oxidoreductase [candidate division LCP-89 bacterium B3_LCP]|uniref:Oxidoreductase n=1 Tax=candidate division LCP-89 bacterium B3_LCP TaxID=2012998 RepID=A0A532V152_UNCL8|nr:MAG: oxidoreductase [candidate division LCP-89 bacterium B3_LCP]
MLQVIQDFKSGQIRLVDVPPPTVSIGMVLVRTHASAISVGTERATADVGRKSLIGKAKARPDQVKKVLDNVKREGVMTTVKKVKSKLEDWKQMGYSSAGVVLSVGAGVDDLKPGMRVACGGAEYAVHSEAVLVPRNLCVPITDEVAFEDAAFTTISSIALQGIRKAEVRLGDNVIVMGLGLLGLIATSLLKASGANVLGLDIREGSLEWAQKMGADRTALLGRDDPKEAVLSWTDGRGADSAILTVATQSAEPMQTAPHLLRDRGRIVLVGVAGLELEREPFYMGDLELHFSRSYGPGRYDTQYEEKGIDYPIGYVRWTERRNMEAVVDLMAQGKFRPSELITHHYKLQDAVSAYDAILSGEESPIGVLLDYSQEPDLSTHIQIKSRPPVKKLGIGLIGAGSFARSFVLPEVAKCGDAELRMVADARGHTARMIAEKYEIPEITTDAQKVLEDDSVNLVFILTRHDTHGPFALEALRRGKMVYVEKPLVRTPEELAELRDVLKKASAPWFMTGFNRVFSPHADFLKEHFRGGTTFPLFRINAGLLPGDHWLKDSELGGGRWIGEGCHFLHFAINWMNAEPQSFKAVGIPVQGDQPDENLNVLLDFGQKGTFNLLYTSRGAAQYSKEHLEIWGEGKTAVLDDFRTTTVFPAKKSFKTRGQDKGHSVEIRKTLEAALAGTPPPLDMEEQIATHDWLFRIAEEMRRES